MQNWVGVVVAVALIVQVTVLTVLFLHTKRAMEKLEKTLTDLHARAGPILTRVQILLDDTQPKISTMRFACSAFYQINGSSGCTSPMCRTMFSRAAHSMRKPANVATPRT